MTKQRKWVGLGLLLAGLMAGWVSFIDFSPRMRESLREPEVPALDERLLENIEPLQAQWLLSQDGGHWGSQGWLLQPHEEGRLTVAMPGEKKGEVVLRLWAHDPGQIIVQWIDATGAHRLESPAFDGRIIKFEVVGKSLLELASSNQHSYDFLTLDGIAAVWRPSGESLPIPWGLGSAFLLAVVGCAVLTDRIDPKGWRVQLGCVLIVLAAAGGMYLRYEAFDMARGLPVDPDVVAYRQYIDRLQWWSADYGFYSGNFQEREPLHIGLLKIWMGYWDHSFPSIRWYTVVLSVLLIVAAGGFVWKATGNWMMGGISAWVMALHPLWVNESTRGLRLEAMTLFVIATLSVWLWGKGWMGAVLLGFLTGAASLLQSPILSVLIGLFWLTWLMNYVRVVRGLSSLTPGHWRWFHLALASALSVLLFIPHLYGLYKVHGDPFWPARGYARWLANNEFPERLGTEGFPTVESFHRNGYAGPPISYGEYMWKLHSIPQLIQGQLKGWGESIAYMSVSPTPRLNHLLSIRKASGKQAMMAETSLAIAACFVVFLSMTVIGWVSLLKDPRYWWAPFFSLWGCWYVAYLYNARLVELFRHTAHVYPMLLLCFAWGCKVAFQYVRTLTFSRIEN